MADVEIPKPELPQSGDRLIDRYTIIHRVSLGGFGAVYRALQDNLGREIALKVLLPDVVSNNKDYIEQFRQEALLTSQLRHPNTITIFDYGQTDNGLLFIAMEWLDGKTLTEVLKEEGALSYERCLHISNQILKSLSEAHDRGMVHRDLKPSNLVLCTQYGEPDFVKVLDFGLVKNLSEETLSMRGKAVEAPQFTAKRRAPGTPHYMAPEQAMGKGTTTSADIYAFGLILYEMLTGKRAVDGNDKMDVLLKQVRQPIPPLPEEFRDTFLGKIVMRCVEKDPLKRPQNATVLLRDYQLNEENRGIELKEGTIEAQARWKTLAESRGVASEVISSAKDIFFGRVAEIEEFNSILQKGLSENTGTTIVINGQTGIGKTALVNRFSSIFLEKTKGFLIPSAFLPQNNLAFSAIRSALKKFLQIQSDDASDARAEIRHALARYEINDAYMTSFLTHFLIGKLAQGGEERDQSELRLEELFDMFSRVAPVMFTVENIHWADTDSLNLLWKLALSAVTKHRPFFIVATFRHTALADNRELQMLLERFNRLEHIFYREINLGWLGKKDCVAIIDNAIKMQRPMANQCLALSKGNPLFLNIVLRYILDEKASGDDDQKLVIPNSIEKITLKRIDQIVRKYSQPDYREILRRAALMGETFSLQSVEALLRKDGQYHLLDCTSRALDVWRREGILRRQYDSEGAFEFIHPYIVEFFNVDSTPELHLNVARTKELLSETNVFINLEDIARHFKLAGDKKQAFRYLDFAANSALQNTNFIKAKKFYAEMLPLLDQEDQDNALALRINQQLGELSLRLSEYGPARDYFNRTLMLAEAAGNKHLAGIAYCGIAETALAQNRHEEANSNYNRAKLALSEDDAGVQSKLLLGLGRLSKLKADWQAALACFQKAYDYSSNIVDFDLMGNALFELGKIYLALGQLQQAHECFLSAQKNFQTVGNTADEADILISLSYTYCVFMRPDDARLANESAIEIYQKLGDQLGFANALAQMAALNIHLLVFDEAQKFVLRSIPIFKEFHSAIGGARTQALLSKIEMNQGQYDAATRLANQALAEYLKTDNFSEQISLYTWLGHLATLQNNFEAARQHLSQAEMLLDIHQSSVLRCHLLFECGLLCECQCDFANAERNYQAAQDAARQSEYPEQIYIARLNVIRVNVYFSPGRWYYDELLKIANEARTYGLKRAQLTALMYIVWFEGVYGEQRAWENLMGELVRFIQIQRLPANGLLRQFEFVVDITRYVSPEVSMALHRSATWIRQYLTQSSGT